MDSSIYDEINKDSFRRNLSRYTSRAYHLLPPLPNPKILDLGCGTGIPTVTLAVLSKGEIIAVDRDKTALKCLETKSRALKLDRQIKTRHGDITKLKYKKACFDIIWTEGAVNSIGLLNGIKMWRGLLKIDGHMVIHDQIADYQTKLDALADYGYELRHHYIISAVEWFDRYFKPLEKRINNLKQKYSHNVRLMELLNKEAFEIEQFKTRPDDFASIFYILQKDGP